MTDRETTMAIVRALRARYKGDTARYIYAEEVTLATGVQRDRRETRLDAVVMRCWPSEGHRLDGFEVKASKADLRRELQCEDKHASAYPYLDRFWLACPPGILGDGIYDALPKRWGVLVLTEEGTLRPRRNALALHDTRSGSIDRAFAASLMRRALEWRAGDEDIERARSEGIAEGVRSEREAMERRKGDDARKAEAWDRILDALGIVGYGSGRLIDSDARRAVEKATRLRALEAYDPMPIMWRLRGAKRALDGFMEAYAGSPLAALDEDGE